MILRFPKIALHNKITNKITNNFGVRNFFKNKWFSRYLNFGDFKIPKIVLHNFWESRNQENSAHCFGDNYLTDHLVKFLQDRIKP